MMNAFLMTLIDRVFVNKFSWQTACTIQLYQCKLHTVVSFQYERKCLVHELAEFSWNQSLLPWFNDYTAGTDVFIDNLLPQFKEVLVIILIGIMHERHARSHQVIIYTALQNVYIEPGWCNGFERWRPIQQITWPVYREQLPVGRLHMAGIVGVYQRFDKIIIVLLIGHIQLSFYHGFIIRVPNASHFIQFESFIWIYCGLEVDHIRRYP